jgi:hypothetical protein
MYRSDRSDNSKSVVINPTFYAESYSSSSQTHGTNSNKNGQWWEQTDLDAVRA